MPEFLIERPLRLSVRPDSPTLMEDVAAEATAHLITGEVPIRFAATQLKGDRWYCDVGIMFGGVIPDSIFRFEKRVYEDTSSFNVVMLVPTGIGATVGGHAGDATPAATLLSSVCDTLITHPNVLNASDVIQVPPNTLYVEGSLITQLMMGTVALHPVRNNRLLVLIQAHEDEMFTNAAINSVNAARASYGLDARIVELNPKFRMISEYTPSGIAAGRIEGIEYVYHLLDTRLGEFDAVAITSIIELPDELHENYYRIGDDVVNPWGGVEAMLTHAVSLRYGLPAAHAPMLESRSISESDFGIVDPRMAAEVISLAFLQSVLRGLQKSPAVNAVSPGNRGIGVQCENISCLVIPDGCVGLPTLSALINGIPVVAVRGNTNLMKNDLGSLPWQSNRFFLVENYLEAAGVIAALRAGIAPWSVTRPLEHAPVEQPASADPKSVPVKVSTIDSGTVGGEDARLA